MNNHVPQDEERSEHRASTRGMITAGIICLLIILIAVYLSVNAYRGAVPSDDGMTGTRSMVDTENIPRTTYEIKPYNSSAYKSQVEMAKELPQSYYDSTQSSAAPTVTQPEEIEELSFMAPMSGEVLRSFSGESLVFSATLGDWRTHLGTDYKAEAGDKVCSVADGNVSDFYFDELYGNVMTISHAGGYESLYCGINDIVFFEIGDEVKQGDVIGTVSQTLPIEGNDETHLHLEMKKDGNFIDVNSIIG